MEDQEIVNLAILDQQLKSYNQQEILDFDDDQVEKFIKRTDLCKGDIKDFKSQFDLLDEIGEGGFGNVYRCYDKQGNVFVAMKRMPQDINTFKREKYSMLHELQIVQRIYKKKQLEGYDNGPEFVLKCLKYFYIKSTDVLTDKTVFQLYFIYPLADSDLFHVIKLNRKAKWNFPDIQTIPFIWQILLALKSLKEDYQIRHRDLKPKNILKKGERYYLGDFTTCKIQREEDSIISGNEGVMGKSTMAPHTIEYLAPEQKRYVMKQGKGLLEEIKKSAEKGDIFSLAITALCLMFHEITAAELSDLEEGEKTISKYIQQIKNTELRELVRNMSLFDFKVRFSIQQCLDYFNQHLIQFLNKDLIPDSFLQKQQILIPQPLKPKNQIPNSEPQILLQPQDHSLNKPSLPFKSYQQKQSSISSIQQPLFNDQQPLSSEINWDLAFQNRIPFENKNNISIYALDVSKCQKYLVTGNHKGQIFIYNFINKKFLFESKVFQKEVYRVKFTSDSKFIVAGGQDNILQVLEVQETGRFVPVASYSSQDRIRSICIINTEQFIVNEEEKIQFFSIQATKDKEQKVILIKLESIQTQDYVWSLSIDEDKKNVAAGQLKGTLEIFYLENKSKSFDFNKLHSEVIYCIKFTKKSEIIITGGQDNIIQITSIPQKQILQTLQNEHSHRIISLSLFQNNKYLLSGSYDNKINVYSQTKNGKYERVSQFQNTGVSYLFNNSDSYVICSAGLYQMNL